MARRPQFDVRPYEDEEDRVERTVRHAMVSYTNEQGHQEIAYKGDVIEVLESEAERLDELGVFEETYDPETMESQEAQAELKRQESLTAPVEGEPDAMEPTAAPTAIPTEDAVSGMDDEALTEFVNGSSVGDIAEAVATSASAERVKETEQALRGAESRKTLIQAMDAIIAQELAAADNNDDEPVENVTGE